MILVFFLVLNMRYRILKEYEVDYMIPKAREVWMMIITSSCYVATATGKKARNSQCLN